jgi:hypothetical protein
MGIFSVHTTLYLIALTHQIPLLEPFAIVVKDFIVCLFFFSFRDEIALASDFGVLLLRPVHLQENSASDAALDRQPDMAIGEGGVCFGAS